MVVKEILSLIFEGATASGIIFTGYQIHINRKQFNFSTIAKCISDFRSFEPNQICDADHTTAMKYIDIVDEELFYIQNDYLPENVKKEWIDGMINYMPLVSRDNENEVLNGAYCIRLFQDHEERERLFTYRPRIKNAFKISANYDFTIIFGNNYDPKERLKERARLIREIMQNIKKFKNNKSYK